MSMYGWQCHKSCLWMVLNGAKNKLRIDEKFIQSFDDNLEDSDILEVDAKYPKNFPVYTMICCSYLKEPRLKYLRYSSVICTIRKTMSYI